MPLTTAHPLVVLPLRKTPLILPALVIGSMIPDFPQFLQLGQYYPLTHAPIGVLGINLAAGLLALTLWQLVFWPVFDSILPSRWRRWPSPSAPGLSWWLWSVPSISIGAATHLLWDSFTHAWSPRMMDVLSLDVQVGLFPVYHWLQIFSSVLGTAGVAWWMWRSWRTAQPRDMSSSRSSVEQWILDRQRALLVAVPFTTGALVALVEVTAQMLTGSATLRILAVTLITFWGATTILVALFMAVLWHIRRRFGWGPL